MSQAEKTHPLFRWRKENGNRSMQSVADDLGCTQSFISQIEAREKHPSLEMAARLHRLTGIPMEDFAREREAAQ